MRMMKLMMKMKLVRYVFSFMVKRENSPYDAEGACLVVEAGRGGSALEASPHSIQVLLGVEDELLESVGTGHVTSCLEMFTGLCTHLSAPTRESLACECVCDYCAWYSLYLVLHYYHYYHLLHE